MTFQSRTEKNFIDLQILNLSKWNKYLTSLFMFQYHHLNNLPNFFTNFFITNSQIHQHNTRNSTKLYTSHIKELTTSATRFQWKGWTFGIALIIFLIYEYSTLFF
jgi:hypothetical protein